MSIFFLSTGYCHSDNDRLLELRKEYVEFRKNNSFEDIVVFLLDYIDTDEAKSDRELMLFAQINLANIMWIIGRFDNCYSILQNVERQIGQIDNNFLKSRFHHEYSQYYRIIGFYNLSLKQNRLAEYHILQVDENNLRVNWLRSVFLLRRIIFQELNQLDSALYYSYQVNSLTKQPSEDLFLFNFYIDSNEKDSIDKYFNLIRNSIKKQEVSQSTLFYRVKAISDYYMLNKNYDSALIYLDRQVEIAESVKRQNLLGSAYKQMAKYFKLKGDELEYLRYTKKMIDYNHEIEKSRTQSSSLTAETILRLSEEKISNINNSNRRILMVSLVAFLVMIAIIYWTNQKKINAVAIVEEKSRQLELEKNDLRGKVSGSIGDVIELAKQNDPGFLAKYQEVFTERFQKLERLEPPLTTEELKLCAMLSLNFSTKDIANFTFVQPKTIQMKKYRLRKKYELDSSVDLYEWITKQL